MSADNAHFRVHWIDRGVEPKVKPDPLYPNGIDVDGAGEAIPACRIDLPYPARRVGFYSIECLICGITIRLTTAGRPDDPRSLTVACRERTRH